MNIEQLDKLISFTETELINATKKNVVSGQRESIEASLARYRLRKKQIKTGALKAPTIPVKEVLKRLSDLDLTKDPYDEAKSLIGQLSMIPAMQYNLLPLYNEYADSLIRARPYKEGESTFTLPKDLNYKPQKYNSTYQRASTPKETVFYGCLKRFDGELIMTKEGDKEMDNRYVACMEAIRTLSVTDSKALVKVGFGKWIVTEPIHVIAILNHTEFHSENSRIQFFYKEWLKYVQALGIEDDAIAAMDFFSDKFADEEAGEGKEHLYMLSAMFTESCMMQPNIQGVLYPSVRTTGQGICVALNVPTAESKIRLDVAGESLVYKHKGEAIIDNLSIVSNIAPDATTFKFEDCPKQYQMGEKIVLEKLGLKSVDELKV